MEDFVDEDSFEVAPFGENFAIQEDLPRWDRSRGEVWTQRVSKLDSDWRTMEGRKHSRLLLRRNQLSRTAGLLRRCRGEEIGALDDWFEAALGFFHPVRKVFLL